jgi:hypothetical protein
MSRCHCEAFLQSKKNEAIPFDPKGQVRRGIATTPSASRNDNESVIARLFCKAKK